MDTRNEGNTIHHPIPAQSKDSQTDSPTATTAKSKPSFIPNRPLHDEEKMPNARKSKKEVSLPQKVMIQKHPMFVGNGVFLYKNSHLDKVPKEPPTN